MTPGRLCALLLVLVPLLFAGRAQGHSIDSSTLTLTEIAAGQFRVDWQTTAGTLKGLRAPAQYPKPCQQRGSLLDCGPLGLKGTIEFPWLKDSASQVTVLIDWLSGSRLLRVVGRRSPRLTVYGIPESAGWRFLEPIAVDYIKLGIEHILTGFDHLMFVLAVTMLVQNRRALVGAITAFTAAHSLTLSATVLGWLWLPPAAVETTIALSIVLACTECLRPADSLARRAPWLVTFAFGLLHGMGFASALLETGLPEKHIVSALAFFNVGVELGQLAAITVFLGAGWLVTRIERRPAWTTRAFVYAMGTTAAYWSLERGALLFVR
ncbi:MAG: HupE/UreJ family protein [Polyangiaceae bacterium]